MYCWKSEFKTIWILVLLVYSEVSGSEFYDSNNSETIDANTSREENLHTFSASHEVGNADGASHHDYDKGLRQAKTNFLTKLKQRQRQRQSDPAIEMSSREQLDQKQSLGAAPVFEGDWHRLLVGLLGNLDNEISGQDSFRNDLATVMRYLAQQKEEALAAQNGFEPSFEQFSANGQKRAAALRSSMSRRSHSFPYRKERFSPSISVGALTNLGDFFQHLKHNLESLESKNLSHDQVKLLEGENMISNLRKEFTDDYPKPAGSAAFLHAIRNYRPSNRIRALVSSVPDLYRGTNYHDPVYKLAGLGK